MNVTRVFFYVSSVFPFSSYVKLFEILLTAIRFKIVFTRIAIVYYFFKQSIIYL